MEVIVGSYGIGSGAQDWLTVNKTILTVDDDDLVRNTLARQIEHQGMRVLQAASGEAALTIFRSEKPDLVLLDLRMPGMDGITVLPLLVKEAPETPVIVVSGGGSMDDAVEALRRGAWDFIIKPIYDPQVLRHVIDRALEAASLRRQNREYRENLEVKNQQLDRALHEIRQDQQTGQMLQFQLLPPDGIQLHGFSFQRALFPSQSLSGDFVDYFSIDDTHFGFYLADVAGHGAASGFVTGILTTLVGKYRQQHTFDGSPVILQPGALLSALDRDMRGTGIDRHVTMFYGVIDTTNLALTYSNAALFPYPLVHDSQGTRALETPGRPLALFGDGQHATHTLTLGTHGRIVVFSDGIFERQTGTLADKQAQLATLTARHANIAPLLAELSDATGPADDDIAVLMIRWGGDA